MGIFGHEIRREFIRLKRFHVHFDQADKWAPKSRLSGAAPVDDDAHRVHDRTVLAHDIDRLLDSPATRHNIFGHDKVFTFFDFETAAQNQIAGFLLHKDVAFT